MNSAFIFLSSVVLHAGTVLAQRRLYKLPWWHPPIQYIAEELIPAPPNHPPLDDDPAFQDFVDANTGRSHRFFDGPGGYLLKPFALPRGHPDCDRYFDIEETPYDDFPTVYFDHPDIEETYLNGKPLPKGHPSLSSLYQHLLPANHPDLDDLYSDGVRPELPDWHPSLSLMLNMEDLPNGKPSVPVYFEHPSVSDAYEQGRPMPAGHPSVEDMLIDYLPPGHPLNLDEMMEDPAAYPLPLGHPDLSSFISVEALPRGLPSVPVYFDHPSIAEAYEQGRPMPAGHLSVEDTLLDYLPPGHPTNLDEMMENPSYYPLPLGHPDLSDFISVESLPRGLPSLPVYFDHPNPTEAYEQGRPMPAGHVSVESMFLDYLPPGHPTNLDEMLENPADYPLPLGHPDLSSFLSVQSLPNGLPSLPVYFEHPNVTESYERGRPMPVGHPSVEDMLLDYLPPNHPLNLDEMMEDPAAYPLPLGHPDLSSLISIEALPKGLPSVPVYFDHPSIAEAYEQGRPMPAGHVSVEDMLLDYLPPGHPTNLDEMMEDPAAYPLPLGHPDLSSFLSAQALPRGLPSLPVYFDHPDIMEWYEQGRPMPSSHPSVTNMLLDYLPPGHPANLDEMMYNPTDFPLPLGHPDLSSFISVQGSLFVSGDESSSGESGDETSSGDRASPGSLVQQPVFSVFGGHPLDLDSYPTFPPMKHPPIHHLYEDSGVLPPSHPNIDDLLADGFTLPSWHPPISTSITPRESALSPGALLCYVFAAVFVAAVVIHNTRRWRNSKRTREIILEDRSQSDTLDGTIGTMDESCLCPMDRAIVIDDGVEVSPESASHRLPRLDQRHWKIMQLHKNHHDEHLCPEREPLRSSIVAYREKSLHSSTFVRTALHRRMIGTHESNGDVVLCLLYMVANVAVLLASPGYDFNVGFGSLAAGNIVFVVLSATKNSAITWFLGVPFDHTIVFHRFIGRVAVAAAFIHACFYFDRLLEFMHDRMYKTGFIALLFGLILAASSLDWIRRRYFGCFYWSHAAFVGFFVCVYLHASAARPFIIASVVLYGIDRMLHVVWTQLPRKTTTIKKVGHRDTAFVRFDKPHLISLLGRYKVGQYLFVNFPELSLTEWHPFSVASGPSEPFLDLYIRALGDHTKRVVDHAEKCASSNKPALIRVDGPYGNLPFNYRRYGAIILVGAGIGITPLIGMIKDIYERGKNDPRRRGTICHCLKDVRVVWIMPYQSETVLFLDQLLAFRELALHDPSLPLLDISLYFTREEEGAVQSQSTTVPTYYSRPDFPSVMESCTNQCKQDGASSILVYACGPGRMINQLWDASMKRNAKDLRVDFHHETFEF